MSITATGSTSSSSRFVGNAAISTILHFSSTLVVLAIAPFALKTIGLEQYGLWALLNTITRYSLLADFGIGPSVTKHVAQFSARGDRAAVRASNTIGTLYYAVMAIVLLIVTVVFAPALLGHLALSPSLKLMAPHFLLAFMGSYLINMVFWMSPSATLNGLGVFRITSASNAIAAVVYAISALVFLHAGFGVYSLIDASYVQIVTALAIGLTMLTKMEGLPWVNPFRISRARYREILGFGGWLQISTVAWLVISDTPALVVGYFVGVEFVGILDIGTRLARAVKALAFNFNSALLPTLSARHAEGGTAKVATLLPHAMRMMGLISMTAAGLLIGGAPIVLPLWLGNSLIHENLIQLVLSGLAVTYALDTLTDVAATATRGLGLPRLEAWYSVAYALTAFVISISLTPHFGVLGIVVASLGGVTAGTWLFFSAAKRAQAFAYRDLFAVWFPQLLIATVLATGLTLVASEFLAAHISARGMLIPALLFAGAFYGVVAIFTLRAVRFFRKTDLATLASIVPERFGFILRSRLTRGLFCAQ